MPRSARWPTGLKRHDRERNDDGAGPGSIAGEVDRRIRTTQGLRHLAADLSQECQVKPGDFVAWAPPSGGARAAPRVIGE
jgi:hypothetical protein